MKIGIFDSGFGGLDVLMGIKKHPALEDLDFVYLGDNARVPYGNKSQETIFQYTKEALDFLFRDDCHLVIIACNTASARALRRIQQEWLSVHYPERRVLGVIIPAAERASRLKVEKLGVIATDSTVKSRSYPEELNKLSPTLNVIQQSCPMFVPLIEHGEESDDVWDRYLDLYLRTFLANSIDTLILGCTHYGIISDRIKGYFERNGRAVEIINQADIVGDSLAQYLKRHPEHKKKLAHTGSLSFYVTDDEVSFSYLARKYFGSAIDAKRIVLD